MKAKEQSLDIQDSPPEKLRGFPGFCEANQRDLQWTFSVAAAGCLAAKKTKKTPNNSGNR